MLVVALLNVNMGFVSSFLLFLLETRFPSIFAPVQIGYDAVRFCGLDGFHGQTKRSRRSIFLPIIWKKEE